MPNRIPFFKHSKPSQAPLQPVLPPEQPESPIGRAAPAAEPPSPPPEPKEIPLSPLESRPITKKLPKILKKSIKTKKEKSDFTPNGHAIDALMQENRHAELLLKECRRILRKIDRADIELNWRDLTLLFSELKEIEFHYQRKEELLFPRIKNEQNTLFLEQFIEQHKEIKKNVRNLIQTAKSKNLKNTKHLFFQTVPQIRSCILKEEQVLIPMALSQLKDEDWEAIRSLGKTIGYSWIEKDQDPLALHLKSEGIKLDGFRLETGFLSINQIDQIFNSLPLEITIVNEAGIIVYYNNENSRFFKRLPNFIGERYFDCLSMRSEKHIKKIIDLFKNKEQKEVSLQYTADQKTFSILYKPLYFKNGDYHGFAEIAVDLSSFSSEAGDPPQPQSSPAPQTPTR